MSPISSFPGATVWSVQGKSLTSSQVTIPSLAGKNITYIFTQVKGLKKSDLVQAVHRLSKQHVYESISFACTTGSIEEGSVSLGGELQAIQTFLYDTQPKTFDSENTIGVCLLQVTPDHQALILGVMDEQPEPLPQVLKELLYLLNMPAPQLTHEGLPALIRYRQAGESDVKIPLQQQLAYWKEQLLGLPSLLELPIDYSRPSKQDPAQIPYQHTVRSFALSGELLMYYPERSLFIAVMAGFITLLSRYCRTYDIAIGVPIKGVFETNATNELDTNIVIVRTLLTENTTFAESTSNLERLWEVAYANRHVPYTEVEKAVLAEGNAEPQPLTQVLFSWQQGENEATAEVVADDALLISGIDLHLSVVKNGSAVTLCFRYNASSLNATTVVHMAEHLETLLRAAAVQPEKSVMRLPILTEAERHQLLVTWNQTEVAYPHQTCVHQLFEEQAASTPLAVAVQLGEQFLTYQQLNENANQLARYLQRIGVGPDVLVGLCLDRSLEMLVGMLGILKAGGAFVPLDTSYPESRLAFMVDDAQLSILLATTSTIVKLPAELAVPHTILLDKDWPEVAHESVANLAPLTTPDHLIYIMYTSGSTGKPKGVTAIHRGVVRLIKGANYVQLDAQEVFLLMAPVAFDASTFEIWGCLCNGGRLVVMPPGTPSLGEIKTVIQEKSVTTLWLSAGLFQLMAENGLEELTSLRQVLAGGDALSISHVRKLVGQMPYCTFINGYGPTENTTFTCCYVIKEEGLQGKSVPIGKPIPNTTIYILDAHLQPVPVGVPGELYTGGAGLARDYFRQPALTAEKYIPNPFSSRPEDRLYKTGDLVRYLPDGNIEFIGRIDNQVKIRGFRIELSEIEYEISTYEQVKEVTVVVREAKPGDKRIVAYVVPRKGVGLDIPGLRAYLKEKLPNYMVPAAFISLENLPLTANGKIDRRALPPVDWGSSTGNAGILPRNATEQTLANIWKEILRTESFGVQDNFFESGGNSLLAVQLVSAIQKQTGSILPVSIVFAQPTIESLAKAIGNDTEAIWEVLVPIQPKGKYAPLFCIHGGAGTVEYAYKLAQELGQEYPVYGLQAQGLNGIDAPSTSVEAMAELYLHHIRQVQPQGPYNLAGYSFGATVAYEIAQQLRAVGERIDNLFIFDAYPTFNAWKAVDGIAPYHLLLNQLSALRQAYQQQDKFSRKVKGVYKRIAFVAQALLWRAFKKIERKLNGINHTVTHADLNMTEISLELMGICARLEKAYLLKTYEGELVFFHATQNSGTNYLRNFDFNWRQHAKGGVIVHDVDGSHHTLFKETEYLKQVATLVKTYIDSKSAKGSNEIHVSG